MRSPLFRRQAPRHRPAPKAVFGPAAVSGALTGTCSFAFTASGVLTGSGALVGTCAIAFTCIGVLTDASVPPPVAPGSGGLGAFQDQRITEDQWLMAFIQDLVTSGRLER